MKKAAVDFYERQLQKNIRVGIGRVLKEETTDLIAPDCTNSVQLERTC